MYAFFPRAPLHLRPPPLLTSFLTPSVSFHLILLFLLVSLSLSLSEGQRYSHISRSPWQRCSKKEREAARGRGWWGDWGGWSEGWRGWGCVNNANATSLIIDCMFSPPLSAPAPLNPSPWYNTELHLLPPTFISLFSFVSFSFHSHYSCASAGVLFPVVLKLNLHIVLSLLSLLLLGHLADSVGIHGNPEKWHRFLGEYQYRQASINIPVTHYQSNGEVAAVTPDYK